MTFQSKILVPNKTGDVYGEEISVGQRTYQQLIVFQDNHSWYPHGTDSGIPKPYTTTEFGLFLLHGFLVVNHSFFCTMKLLATLDFDVESSCFSFKSRPATSWLSLFSDTCTYHTYHTYRTYHTYIIYIYIIYYIHIYIYYNIIQYIYIYYVLYVDYVDCMPYDYIPYWLTIIHWLNPYRWWTCPFFPLSSIYI